MRSLSRVGSPSAAARWGCPRRWRIQPRIPTLRNRRETFPCWTVAEGRLTWTVRMRNPARTLKDGRSHEAQGPGCCCGVAHRSRSRRRARVGGGRLRCHQRRQGGTDSMRCELTRPCRRPRASSSRTTGRALSRRSSFPRLRTPRRSTGWIQPTPLVHEHSSIVARLRLEDGPIAVPLTPQPTQGVEYQLGASTWVQHAGELNALYGRMVGSFPTTAVGVSKRGSSSTVRPSLQDRCS